VNWPPPQPGQVIRYSYLWKNQADTGREEGSKDRPCAIVLVILKPGEKPLVRVLPVTHAMPNDLDGAVEIPAATKLRLGLDAGRSWVILDEANDFTWPGPDLRPAVNGDLSSVVYGILPPGFMKQLTDKLFERRAKTLANIVRRTE
jgi:hypothetical protein